MEGLEDRVRLLERRLRRMGVCTGALALAVLSLEAWRLLHVPGEVAARRFVLQDAQGGRRGTWEPTTATAGETDGETQYAAITCLVMNSQKQAEATLRLCSPWESHGGPTLSMRERTGSSVQVSAGAYSAQIVGRTS